MKKLKEETMDVIIAADYVVADREIELYVTKQFIEVDDFEVITGCGIGRHGDFDVTQLGVHAVQIDDRTLSLLSRDARLVVLEAIKHQLVFPCNQVQFAAFVEAVGWPFTLPDGYIETIASQQVIAGATAKAKGGRKPGKQRALLGQILEALEVWAKGNNMPFDRQAMPGQVGRGSSDESGFHWFCASLFPRDFLKSARTFENYRAGLCVFPPYAKRSNFYIVALPPIAQSLQAAECVSASRIRD